MEEGRETGRETLKAMPGAVISNEFFVLCVCHLSLLLGFQLLTSL